MFVSRMTIRALPILSGLTKSSDNEFAPISRELLMNAILCTFRASQSSIATHIFINATSDYLTTNVDVETNNVVSYSIPKKANIIILNVFNAAKDAAKTVANAYHVITNASNQTAAATTVLLNATLVISAVSSAANASAVAAHPSMNKDTLIDAAMTAYSSIVSAASVIGPSYVLSAITTDLAHYEKGVDLLCLPLWIASEPLPSVFAQQWQNLQIFMLEFDPGFQYWIDWYEARLRGEPIIWEEISNQVLLPEEVLKQEVPAINAYLIELSRNQAIRPLNRGRVILIGPGEAGKTSLLRALHGEQVVEGKEPMTPGIEIRESCLDVNTGSYRPATEREDSPIVHFWDFGGQVMYHATHQFFLRSNCVYILVLDGRRAAAGGSEADYWLEHIRAFTKKDPDDPGAPVLIVGNKADIASMDWEQNRLRNKYPNIWPQGFYPLACTEWADPNSRYHYDFARFKRDLHDALREVRTVQVQFTPEEFQVLSELRRRSPKETFLPKAEYQRLCEENKLPANPETLLDLLDKLGVIIHFPKLHRLDKFLLNPRWLTYGVYQIITREQSRVSEADAIAWLSQAEISDNLGNRLGYPCDHCGHILDAMEQFKVAYRLPPVQGVPRFEIPSLLPNDEPALDFPEGGARVFRFRFEGLLPPQLLPQLIVARHADIDRGKVWRHGVLLRRQRDKAWVLLRGDAYARTLTLWMMADFAPDSYFWVLRQAVEDVLGTMPELSREEEILLPRTARLDGGAGPDGAEPWANWVNVWDAHRDGERHYREKGVKYDLSKVLGVEAEDGPKPQEARSGGGDTHYHNHYGEKTVMSNYTNHQGQVGLMGPNGRVENNTFQFQQNQNPALDQLGGLLGQLLADLQAAKSEVAAFEVETAIRTLNDVRSGKEQGKGWLKHFLSNIKNNVGPVADGISVIAAARDAATKYGPPLVAVVEAALHALGG